MNQEEIMKKLPHRDEMLLVDGATIEEMEDGRKIVHGVYHVSGNEWFLRGHFPDAPVVPGVVLCEILAQSAGLLLSDSVPDGKIPMYTSLDGVRFKSPVVPGDAFETTCEIVRAKGPFYFVKGAGYVGERLCVKAEFSFAIADRGVVCSQKS